MSPRRSSLSSRSFSLLLSSLSLASLTALAACGGGAATGEGGGDEDVGAADTSGGGDTRGDTSGDGGGDTGATDTTSGDTSSGDTGGGDTGATDTGASDTGATDTGGSDTGASDTGAVDTAPDAFDAGIDLGLVACTVDTDADTVFDEIEGRDAVGGPTDTDADGTPDYLDLDSDNDGIPDATEWPDKSCATGGINDADGDGIANFRDLDSDANGLLDKDEGCAPASVLAKLGKPACTLALTEDLDGDGVNDFLDSDNDHDSSSTAVEVGLEDIYELRNAAGTYVGLSLDFDGDGVPDLWDRDSDNDNVFDREDGLTDTDLDGAQNFRDLDSDADGVPDWCEARANPVSTPSFTEAAKSVRDTDLDSKPDFIDLDADGDLLVDKLEDKNGDCMVQKATETDRILKDSDGDGVDDLVEVTLLGAPMANDNTKTPNNQGKFYFVEPYSADGSAKPTPTSTPLALSTTLNDGDVAFVIDTTTSMDSIEAALSSSIGTIISDLTNPLSPRYIPNLNLGVIGYDDALAKPWGDSAGDSFIWFPNGASTGSWMTGTYSDATAAASKLTKTTPGGSYPEGTVPALWWTVTGDSFSFNSCSTSPCSPTYAATTKTFAGATGLDSAHFGGLHFRKSALPIIVNTSDANMHNGKTTACKVPVGTTAIPDSLCFATPGSTGYTATGAQASSLGHSPSIDELLTQLNTLGAKYIGVSVHGPSGSRSSDINRTTDPTYYASAVDMLYLARGTGSKVEPTALNASATIADCKTSNPGATLKNQADADGLCPLVVDIPYAGTGLGTIVTNGILALLQSVKYDVHVEAIPVLVGSIDPVNAFMKSALPMPGGGTDPVTLKSCVTFPGTQTADKFVGPKATVGTDGDKETITALNPGPLYCFAVTPKENTTVAATSTAQVFHATLRVFAEKPPPAGGTFTLGADRDVLFIVPPLVN